MHSLGRRIGRGGLPKQFAVVAAQGQDGTFAAAVSGGQKDTVVPDDREEIFGPVLVLIGYDDDDDAVRIANDTVYGLAGYISGSQDRAVAIARRIRTGNMHVNGAGPDFNAPFGGYKQSGNGREWGPDGLEEFLETKAILGYGA
jgi:acyl-CoA reductase-like NAD-dependent aldehyde dehydrogenase